HSDGGPVAWRRPPAGQLTGCGHSDSRHAKMSRADIVNVSSEVREPRGTLLCRDPRSGLSQISWRTTVAHHPEPTGGEQATARTRWTSAILGMWGSGHHSLRRPPTG